MLCDRSWDHSSISRIPVLFPDVTLPVKVVQCHSLRQITPKRPVSSLTDFEMPDRRLWPPLFKVLNIFHRPEPRLSFFYKSIEVCNRVQALFKVALLAFPVFAELLSYAELGTGRRPYDEVKA